MAANQNILVKYSHFFEFFAIICLVYYISFESSQQHFVLFIGIFSAPQNFHQRLSQRQTWLKLAEPGGSIKYNFVIGTKLCKVPEIDRINPYVCQQRPILHLNDIYSTSLVSSAGFPLADGYSFSAIYNISVTHLGLPQCFASKFSTPVRVKLKDGFDGRTLASVTFLKGDEAIKSVRNPVYFPKGSEGYLVVEGTNITVQACCSSFQNKIYGAILVGNYIKDDHILPFEAKASVCPFMNYKILENNTASEAKSRETKWITKIEEIYKNIEDEQKTFNDIVLLNVTDVYQNLPKKLLKFLTRIDNDKDEFDFLLKTDDDTFVDLQRVMAELQDPWTSSPGLWWWSAIKQYWHVAKKGKWREENYKSVTYPPFPCGGGYVINRATVRHLAAISENLKFFQGEDVSMGIWLSGAKITEHKSIDQTGLGFSYRAVMTGQCEAGCEWSCGMSSDSQNKCNKVQLSIPDMYTTWEELKRTGYIS